MDSKRRIGDGVLPQELMSAPMSVAQIWNILWARKAMIISVTAILTIITLYVIMMVIPRVYSSTTTLLVSPKVDDPVSGGGSSMHYSFISTQIEFMRSPVVLSPIVERFGLTEKKEFMVGYNGDGSPESKKQFAMESLRKDLKIYLVADSLLISVTMTARDPDEAADIANAVADTYIADQKQRFLEPARERATRYSDQLSSLREKVDEAQEKVAAFRRETGLTDLSGDSTITNRIADLESRLANAAAQRLEAELKLSRIRSGDSTALQNAELIRGLRSRIQAAEVKLAELGESLGSRHPEIVALRADLNENQALLAAEIRTHVEGAQAEVASARSVESRLKSQLTEAKKRQLTARGQQDQATQLLRELDTATKIYQGALDAFETMRLGAEISVFNVQVVNRATPPPAADSRRGRKLLALAIIGGGGGTSVLALLLELLNRRIRSREDMESDLGIPVLVQFQRSI